MTIKYRTRRVYKGVKFERSIIVVYKEFAREKWQEKRVSQSSALKSCVMKEQRFARRDSQSPQNSDNNLEDHSREEVNSRGWLSNTPRWECERVSLSSASCCSFLPPVCCDACSRPRWATLSPSLRSRTPLASASLSNATALSNMDQFLQKKTERIKTR